MTALIQIQNATIYIGQDARPQTERTFRSPIDKCPGGGSTIHVNPVSGSSLGTIVAYAVYGNCNETGAPPAAVYAQVYPYNSLPGVGNTPVQYASAVPTQATIQSAGVYTWSALPNVDSFATGAQNFFVLWSKARNTDTPTTSDNPIVQFTGLSSGGSTCSYGSVSGGTMAAARELTCRHHLHITIPNGVNHGAYTATAVADMRWNVTIRGINYAFVGGDGGANIVIQGPQGSIAATSVTFDPFVAMFPGAFFEATHDVAVTVA